MSGKLSTFFKQAPDFDFANSRIRDFSKTIKEVGGDQEKELTNSLARIQRIYMISPHPKAMTGLVQAGFNSARQVAKMTRGSFIKNYANVLGGDDAATVTHERAVYQNLRVQQAALRIQEIRNDISPIKIMGPGQELMAEAAITNALPDYATLFGRADVCECRDCLSVYSPAAYFVDILQFLDNIIVTGTDSVLTFMLKRRPDIEYLLLTCENTNTLIPYIDPANEVMEYYVTHWNAAAGKVNVDTATVAHDTGSATAAELRSNPQYINQQAYKTIYQNGIYPFSLPYHQPLDTIRTYLKFLKTSRASLMKVFPFDLKNLTGGRPSVIPAPAIDAETLLLNLNEYGTLTANDYNGNAFALKSTREYYGFPVTAANYITILSNAAEFISRSGIAYTDLVEISKTFFINMGQSTLDIIQQLFSGTTIDQTVLYNELKTNTWNTDASVNAILAARGISPVKFDAFVKAGFADLQKVVTLYNNTTSCGLDQTNLRSIQWIYEHAAPGDADPILDDKLFSRFQRFILLWKRLGWTVHELDCMITACAEKDITVTLLAKLAAAQRINEKAKLPWVQLASLWGNIDTYGTDSLYARLFFQKTGNDQTKNVFNPNPFADLLAVNPGTTFTEGLAAVLAAFKISATDFAIIAIAEGINPDTDLIVNSKLSAVYRNCLLAGMLSVSIPELQILKKLSGINPFASPASTADFIELAATVKETDFDIKTLDYIITGTSAAADNITLPTGQLVRDITGMRNRLLKIDTDNPAATGIADLKRNAVIGATGISTGMDEQNTRIVKGTVIDQLVTDLSTQGLNATYFSDTTFTTPAFAQIDPRIDFNWDGSPRPATLKTGSFSVRWDGWISIAENDDYDFMVAVADKGETVILTIDGTKILDTTADLVNTSWVKKISLSGGVLHAIKVEYVGNKTKSGITLSWQTQTLSATVIDAGALYTVQNLQKSIDNIRLFHRAALFISSYSLTVPELNYLTIHAKDFSTIDFTALTIVHWRRIAAYSKLRKTISAPLLLSLFQLAFDEDLANPAAVTSDGFINRLVTATAWKKEYLQWLTGNSTGPVASYYNMNISSFKSEAAYLQIQDAFAIAKTTGMGIGDNGLPAWVSVESAVVTFDDLYGLALSIKNTVKAKYKEEDWFKIARQLNDLTRENQKQALIAYLLTNEFLKSQNVNNADQLFEFLLIDVQMSACMDTSRIIQATMAVQQFVSRCLLGLEAARGVPLTAFTDDDKKKWEWMKHYNVEAAWKKLCVYPENYLDETLRDDKTPFFKELESELQKADITARTAEDAFRNYLYKLNEVSRLEVVGTYKDDDAGIMHVFARTHAAPYNYFYRYAEIDLATPDGLRWHPWEHVQLDIKSIDDGPDSGVHLIPIVWRKRLFLFLPELTEKHVDKFAPGDESTVSQQANRKASEHQKEKYWEIRMAWSEYADGKWTPKKVSKESITPFLKDWVHSWQPFNSSQSKVNIPIQESIIGYEKFLANPVLEPSYSMVIANLKSKLLPLKSLPPVRPKDFVFVTNIYNDILSISAMLSVGYLTTLSSFGGDDRPCYMGSFSWMDIQGKLVPDSDDQGFRYTSDYGKDTDETKYEPFFQAYQEKNQLNLASTGFLDTGISHRVLFTNNVDIKDFKTKLQYPFFYSDTTLSRVYFGVPLDTGTVTKLRNAGSNRFIYMDTPDLRGTDEKKVINYMPGIKDYAEYVAANVDSQSLMVSKADILANRETTKKVGAFEGAARHRRPAKKKRPKGKSKLAFYTFYHPFTPLFIKRLSSGEGISNLLAADTAEFPMDSSYPMIDPLTPANDGGNSFNYYTPEFPHVKKYVAGPGLPNYYIESVDFHVQGAYSMYNWELFFHAPLYIATRLSKNGKYAEAMNWFHYIFNPFSTEPKQPGNDNSPFWQVLPFKTTPAQNIIEFFAKLAPGYKNSEVEEWRKHPFQPFVIARGRLLAFMKNVMMAYLDNLLAWADELYSAFTREKVTEASQLYVFIADLLGPKPEFVPKRGTFLPKSYHDLKPYLNDFGDAEVQLENIFPFAGDVVVLPGPDPAPFDFLGVSKTLYFCIPPNDKLLGYWTTVAKRLFNIRHCRNIKGIEQKLPLYEPPLDPALLVRAFAQGLDIGSIVSDLEGPEPLYRYSYNLQKAREFCNEVTAFGNALLSACEKSDTESVARLRSTQELDLLGKVTAVKERQVLEAKANRSALETSRDTAIQKLYHYVVDLIGNAETEIPDTAELRDTLNADSDLPAETRIAEVTSPIEVTLAATDERGVKIIPKEKLELDKSQDAFIAQGVSSGMEMLASIFHLLPNIGIMTSPFGVGAKSNVAGGDMIANSISAAAKVPQILSSLFSYESNHASKMASYIRREQDWVFQANTTIREIVQLDKQLTAADIRIQSAEKELENHRKQIDNAKELDDFLHTKFSNLELYDWMKDQLYNVHKQAYQLAYGMAKKAERSLRVELGLDDSNFIQYGYYVSANKGATASEQLMLALSQMDNSFLELNDHRDEVNFSFSLLQWNPKALLDFRQNGTCDFTLSEQAYDVTYPGQYLRIIKGVRITIPCIVGPYTNVSARLTMLSNRIRKEDNIGSFPSDLPDYLPPSCNNFVTSTAQNDGGLLEFNFRDERYLPLEGAGAVSDLRLALPSEIRAFNYDTIADVIVHVSYTAKQDDGFRALVETPGNLIAAINKNQGLQKLVNLKQDFPETFYQLLNPQGTANQKSDFDLADIHFAYFIAKYNLNIASVAVWLQPKEGAVINTASLNLLTINTKPVAPGGSWVDDKGIQKGTVAVTGNAKMKWTLDAQSTAGFDKKTLGNIFILVRYNPA